LSDDAIERLKGMSGVRHEPARKILQMSLRKDMREILNLVANGIVVTLDSSAYACVCAPRVFNPVCLTPSSSGVNPKKPFAYSSFDALVKALCTQIPNRIHKAQ